MSLQGVYKEFNECDKDTSVCRKTPKESMPYKCECLNNAYENGSVTTCKRNGELFKMTRYFLYISLFFLESLR